jgi:hypothetical protein
MKVKEIIKCNKIKMQNSNYLIYRFNSIVYLLNWMKWKIKGKDAMGLNYEFHVIPYHSIQFLKIQTMEYNFMPLHSINPNIA